MRENEKEKRTERSAGDTRARLSHSEHDMGKTSLGLWGWFTRFVAGGSMAGDRSAGRRFFVFGRREGVQTRERERERVAEKKAPQSDCFGLLLKPLM